MRKDPVFKTPIRVFNWEQLHKKFGRIYINEPTESDIIEGNFNSQSIFVDEDFNMFILDEWKIPVKNEHNDNQ